VPVTERLYVKEPPTRDELAQLARMVEGGARALVAPRARRLKELGIDPATLSEEAILDLIAREPILLRRPILTDGKRAVVGANKAALAAFLAGRTTP
jgi:arsenate reductase-like glutaredoxin family protein